MVVFLEQYDKLKESVNFSVYSMVFLNILVHLFYTTTELKGFSLAWEKSSS